MRKLNERLSALEKFKESAEKPKIIVFNTISGAPGEWTTKPSGFAWVLGVGQFRQLPGESDAEFESRLWTYD